MAKSGSSSAIKPTGSEFHRQCAEDHGVRYRVNRRGTAQQPLTRQQRVRNRRRSQARARGEHAFQVVKQLWGFTKVRYRGLAKNTVAPSQPSHWRISTYSDAPRAGGVSG